MAKPIDYEFEGKKLKLCLSVAVVMEIKDRFGSLEEMGQRIEEEDKASTLDDITWLFAAMCFAGKAYAELTGDDSVDTWTQEQLRTLVDLNELPELMDVVSRAMASGKEQTVEVEAEKNTSATT